MVQIPKLSQRSRMEIAMMKVYCMELMKLENVKYRKRFAGKVLGKLSGTFFSSDLNAVYNDISL